MRRPGMASSRNLSACRALIHLVVFILIITQICGFKAGKHEGKITGLAAFGEPIYVPQLKQMMVYKNGHIKNIANVFFLSALKELERLLPADFKHKDIAASIQTYVEEMVVDLVTYWLKKTEHSNVALAGGIFANVKINQRIHEIPGVQSIFVHPGMSDDGMPVGSALNLYYKLSKKKYDPNFISMDHVYLGPEYTDKEIRAELEKQNVDFTRFENVEKEIARLLSNDAVVARFNSKMEYGPRAFGQPDNSLSANRSYYKQLAQ